MKIRIQVVIEAENGAPEKVEEIARLERGALRAEELGLTLAGVCRDKNGEAKQSSLVRTPYITRE
jgi:hypothetical protein